MSIFDIFKKKEKEEYISILDKKYKPLFDAFMETDRYKEKGLKMKTDYRHNVAYSILTREDLDAITELRIKFGAGIELLKEIDKLCPNLKVLNIETASILLGHKKWNEKLETMPDYEDRRQYIEDMFESNKMTDEHMYHIQKLTQLEELRIPSQTKITELDLSNMSNLKVLLAKDCINLKKVNGLNDNLFTTNYATFDFTGCEKIDNDSIKQISDMFDPNRFEGKTLTPGHLFLPLCSGVKKENDIQNFIDFTSKFNGDTVLFSQSTGGLLINHYAIDVQTFNKSLDRIIQSVCNPNMRDFKKVFKLYCWVTDNVEYDHATTFLEQSDWDMINANHEATREASQNESEKTRSALYTLKTKYGVCVGISELFTSLVTRAKLESVESARQVLCSSNRPRDMLCVENNHQICAIKFKNVGEYYFDPTNDIGKDPLKFFANNKEEIARKFYLSYRERSAKTAPSFYERRRAAAAEKADMEQR